MRPTSLAIALLAVALLVGCARVNPASVRLYVLDCGLIEVEQPVAARLANACYLIVHPAGTLLWETGLNDDLVHQAQGVRADGMRFSVTRPLLAQLTVLGFAPERIDFVGLSHLHPDHVGNAQAFTKATILLQESEYQAAFAPDAAKHHYIPALYTSLAPRMRRLPDDHDVFGDGLVRLKAAPGHTPGHQVLIVNLRRTGSVLLSGDLVHSVSQWQASTIPAFTSDPAGARRAISDIAAFLSRHPAHLWVQHDWTQNQSLKQPPDFYD